MPSNRREYYLKYQRRKYKERKKFIYDYKKGKGCCEKCGWNKYPELLNLHHKERNKKSFNIHSSVLANYSLKRIKEEISKCILVCPNCHMELHMKDGNFHGSKRINF